MTSLTGKCSSGPNNNVISFNDAVLELQKLNKVAANQEKYAKADKSVPIHVRGSLVYNSLLSKYKLTTKYPTIKEGEKIKYIYLKEPNTIRSNVIAFPQVLPDEFDLLKYVDFDLQFDKTYLEPLKIILNSIGWKAEKSSSLESFFSWPI